MSEIDFSSESHTLNTKVDSNVQKKESIGINYEFEINKEEFEI
jgi:hypothetical protein